MLLIFRELIWKQEFLPRILLFSCWTILLVPIGRRKQNFTSFLLVVIELFIKKTKIFLIRFLLRCFIVFKIRCQTTIAWNGYYRQYFRHFIIEYFDSNTCIWKEDVFYEMPHTCCVCFRTTFSFRWNDSLVLNWKDSSASERYQSINQSILEFEINSGICPSTKWFNLKGSHLLSGCKIETDLIYVGPFCEQKEFISLKWIKPKKLFWCRTLKSSLTQSR